MEFEAGVDGEPVGEFRPRQQQAQIGVGGGNEALFLRNPQADERFEICLLYTSPSPRD